MFQASTNCPSPKQLKMVDAVLRGKYTTARPVLVSLKTGATWVNNKDDYPKLRVLLEASPYAAEAGNGPSQPRSLQAAVSQVGQARNNEPLVSYKPHVEAAIAGNIKVWKAAYALLTLADAITLLLAVPLDGCFPKC